MIEEYHPGSNRACSQSLSTRVYVAVDYCIEQHALTLIDQSIGGGQWNSLGMLPFNVGHQGRVTFFSAGAGGARCDAALEGGTCVFVADAVRVRWLAASCDDVGAS